jgi:hypothetical protein
VVTGPKLPAPLPSITKILFELSAGVTMSGLLSPLKSATAAVRGCSNNLTDKAPAKALEVHGAAPSTIKSSAATVLDALAVGRSEFMSELCPPGEPIRISNSNKTRNGRT